MTANEFYSDFRNDPIYVELFEMALTLELVEDGDEIKLEDLKELLQDFDAGLD